MRALHTNGKQRTTRRKVSVDQPWEQPRLRSVDVPLVETARWRREHIIPPGWRNDCYVGQIPVDTVTATLDSVSYQPSAEMIGLTIGSAEAPRRGSVDFAMYFVQFGDDMMFRIYEAGVFKLTVGSVTSGDQMAICRHSDGALRYHLNGEPVYTSERRSAYELFVHSSYWSQALCGGTPESSGLTVVAS